MSSCDEPVNTACSTARRWCSTARKAPMRASAWAPPSARACTSSSISRMGRPLAACRRCTRLSSRRAGSAGRARRSGTSASCSWAPSRPRLLMGVCASLPARPAGTKASSSASSSAWLMASSGAAFCSHRSAYTGSLPAACAAGARSWSRNQVLPTRRGANMASGRPGWASTSARQLAASAGRCWVIWSKLPAWSFFVISTTIVAFTTMNDKTRRRLALRQGRAPGGSRRSLAAAPPHTSAHRPESRTAA